MGPKISQKVNCTFMSSVPMQTVCVSLVTFYFALLWRFSSALDVTILLLVHRPSGQARV